jgi:hypothetical protein
MVDRRVIAALTFLRTQANPFNPLLDPRNRDPHDVPEDVDPMPTQVRR